MVSYLFVDAKLSLIIIKYYQMLNYNKQTSECFIYNHSKLLSIKNTDLTHKSII